jgi:hypothetical protein
MRASVLLAMLVAALAVGGCTSTRENAASSGSWILGEREVTYPAYKDTNIMIEHRSPSVWEGTAAAPANLGEKIVTAFLSIPEGLGQALSLGWVADIWGKGNESVRDIMTQTAYTRIVLGTNKEKAQFEIKGVTHADGNLGVESVAINGEGGLLIEEGEGPASSGPAPGP